MIHLNTRLIVSLEWSVGYFFCDRCCPQPEELDPIDNPADQLWKFLGEAI